MLVIGAGVSGLAAAYGLARAGCRVTVLEQSSRVGGCVHSERTPEGYLVENGPNSLLNLSPAVDRLCRELGLEDQRLFQQAFSRRRYLVKDRALVPVPSRVGDFPRSPLWGAWAKLRALAEPLIPASRSQSDESVAAFVRRRFGAEMVDYGVEPFVAGIFGGNPDDLSMSSSFPRLVALEREYGSVVWGTLRTRMKQGRARRPLQVFSFRGGVGRLPDALRTALGDRVVTGARVLGVRREVRDGIPRFFARVDRGGQTRELSADRLIVATPADTAARLLADLSPPLADQLEQIPYAPVGLVHLGVRRDACSRLPEGSGCLVPKREGLPILGSLWSSNVYPDRAPEGRVLLTNYVGGMRDHDVLKWTDDELVGRTAEALRGLIGLAGQPEFVRVVRHPRAIPQYLIGHAARVAAIDRLLAPHAGLHLAGNYLRGVSVRDCLTHGLELADRIARQTAQPGATPHVGFSGSETLVGTSS
ncbi:MAG TPA: protoporphyrinogen oxidase [Nitrospiria bacterium]|nr:protoporphyrinogen oxidase [Nitrospiria bacterium]